MDNMSPQQQQQDSLNRGHGEKENKWRMKSQSCRRQSAPSVITKALTRSKTLSRESFLFPVCPETCPLVQSFLAGTDRSFLLHGHAQLKTGMQTQERHLFMFNDILVIAKAKSANHFKQKAQVCVCEMWTACCMEEVCEGSTNPERSFVMGWPTCNCVATFSSTDQKEKWLSLLKSRIKEEKENEEPKTIPLKVNGKGINTFAVTKTLAVSNSDSTNEVVRLALQQFSIIGNVKDYQLWVISKRDNTPYPLIGHEFPFSIQMSHVRDTLSQGASRDASPADRQKAMQVEQRQVYKQCQFILKLRPEETLQQVVFCADFSQKPFKRRRSLITWAFWRGSSSHLNELSFAGTASGCLFGQPLSAVCAEDALPKPVMDMLTFLYHEGSWTRGIFRRPAGARAVRELRDSLDAGEPQLPLTRDHVFLIAGVFKEFLRSIPGCLLRSELHEEWMDVLDEEDGEEEQVQDIHRMIRRLPKHNGLLLRYLLAMLHGIEGNAHENQMTSFNLAVCISPSMLWPPGALCSPEVEGEGMKKVCELVKFMIEHCQQILGEDPSSLFGGPPQKINTEEIGSDSWMYPLTDSSYDSVENELDNSSGGESPSSCRRHPPLKSLQGSLDSILTFSDYDQDTDTPHTKPNLRRLGGTRRQDPDLPSQDAPIVDTSSPLETMSLEGLRKQRRRRRSEPAIAYANKLRPCVSGSTHGLTGVDEDGEKELSKKPSSHTLSRSQARRSGGESGLNLHGVMSPALETSSSSLSSTPNSPVPIRSSLDSLDSLGSAQTWATRRGLYPHKTHVPSSSLPVSSTSVTVNSALTSGGQPDQGTCPKESLNMGSLKGRRGLHPNSWFKKDRRLSLTQQDNVEKEEEDNTGGGPTDKTTALGKLVPDKGKAGERGGKPITSNQPKPKTCKALKDAGGGGHVRRRSREEPHKNRHLKQDYTSPPSHHRSTGSLHIPKSPWFRSSDSPCAAEGEVNELKQPSTSLFFKQSGPSLSLFKRHKSRSVDGDMCGLTFTTSRRASEPAREVVAAGRRVSEPAQEVVAAGRRVSEPAQEVVAAGRRASEPARHAVAAGRRASEPARQVVAMARRGSEVVDRTSHWARLPSDPGLKVSDVDLQGGTSETRFCLSPYATKAVRDYFSSHPRSDTQSSQQAALKLVESRREWLRRCSDPTAEADFDQLLFAEESYV